MDAMSIKKDIRSGVKQFGEYTYFDKGPDEVVDIEKYCSYFLTLSGNETADILEEVIRLDKKYGEAFVCSVLVELQEAPDVFWEELMQRETLEKLF